MIQKKAGNEKYKNKEQTGHELIAILKKHTLNIRMQLD